MIPKKPKHLYKEISEDLDMSETLVDNFMTFYYKDVRSNLSKLSHTKVNIDGLGVMHVKGKTIKSLLVSLSDKLERIGTSTFAKYFNRKTIEARLKLVKVIDEKLEEDKLKKKNFVKLKKDGKI
jgi:hypothetical protein